MRVTIQAVVDSENGGKPRVVPLATLQRAVDADPASGLGLFLREGNDVLAKLEAVFVDEQTKAFLKHVGRCHHCDSELPRKDFRTVVYRTAYGKFRIESPRLKSRCTQCGYGESGHATFSPMAEALGERTHPQWKWLQCRYASVMSYRMARIFLRDAFPGGSVLPTSSLKLNVRAVGERSEAETKAATERAYTTILPDAELAVEEAKIALQVDAGYIRALPDSCGGQHWFGAVASKLSVPGMRRTHAHAYVGNSDPMQGARQRAFMASVGIGMHVPVTVLSDGGGDVNEACRIPAGGDRLLDWFHIGMRFEHLQIAARGLKQFDNEGRHRLRREIDSAKWHLWHGNKDRCLERLQAFRKETGWAGSRNALGRLIRYLRGAWPILGDYAQRRSKGLPISTAGAESTVDSVIGQRFKRSGHMRWTRWGANALMQVRCAALNGQDIKKFKGWYPPAARYPTRVAAM